MIKYGVSRALYIYELWKKAYGYKDLGFIMTYVSMPIS